MAVGVGPTSAAQLGDPLPVANGRGRRGRAGCWPGWSRCSAGSTASPSHSLYVVTTAGLPLVWIAWVGMAGGYDPRLIGLGSEEFRRIINAAVSLTAAIAIVSYAVKVDFARGYVLIALPGLGAARHWPPGTRCASGCTGSGARAAHAAGDGGGAPGRGGRPDRAAAPGPLPRARGGGRVPGRPAAGPRSRACRCWAGWPTSARAVGETGADTVAVLACPEMDGVALRRLAWELEKEGTDLCVAPALIDVAGPRTTPGRWPGCR